ncbi:Domain of uncharacterised function(DUF2779) [Metamycoplasma cloacale]|uniref:DUF2779 domain-containing protein n=1 Tax=Metamycoplasma cloacale TaxID=92401 RepID=A0A2Z4LM29_9BACT|nr:DUF2779 domain-containing protein [Metamycoplasma cloacale]AWX42851.1 DUF2779 domain-containing protein [Metamycoplasma cloacale]VEU79327.1 Domain of uncharacterised function(DUF2779) [Metamycoplasma cloacale]
MNKPKYFSYTHFFKLNKFHPYFMLNDTHIEPEIIDELDDEEKFEENIYNELDFNIEKSCNQLEEVFIKNYLSNEEKQSLFDKTYFEKIKYIDNKYHNDNQFKNLINDNNLFNDLTQLINEFNNIKVYETGLNLYSEKAVNFLLNDYKNYSNINEKKIICLSKKASNDYLIAATKNAIAEGFELIINPVFEYKNAISKPFYYDAKHKIVGHLNFSSKTKLKNIIKAYYDVNLIRESGFLVIEYAILLPKVMKRKYVKKGQIDFIISYTSSDSKSGYSSKTFEKGSLEYQNAVLNNKEQRRLIDFVDDGKYWKKFDISSEEHYCCDFEKFIYFINNIDREPLLHKFDFDNCELRDISGTTLYDSDNSVRLKYLEKKYPEWVSSSKVVANIVLFNQIKQEKYDSLMKFKTFYSNKIICVNEDIMNFLQTKYSALFDKNSKLVWFDFEGVSLPIPLMDYNIAWNQIPCQTSIIKTENNEIYDSFDYIYDPQKLNADVLCQIIDDIYDPLASGYVVFNQTYEKSRINELIDMISLFNTKNVISDEKYEDIKNKGNKIVELMIDIADFFKCKTADGVCSAAIHISALKGLYSIKKIEKFVTSNNFDLKHKITPYSELEVKNGSMALQIATSRACNAIKDLEWQEYCSKLKLYCHNDVLAMIMAFDLIQYVLEHKNEYNRQCSIILNEKLSF